jgi:hypothetical protein
VATDVATRAELIVALSDLKVVRLLRAAANGTAGPVSKLGPAPTFRRDIFEARRRIVPEPRFEPRPVIHPTPRFESRPVIHPRPEVRCEPICKAPLEPEQPARLQSPLQPPWKLLPWKNPVQLAPKIKVTILRPDIVSKGMLLDLFI